MDWKEGALAAASHAAQAQGLDPREARVLRAMRSVIIELPREDAVARVEMPSALGLAWRQVEAARVLEERGVPALRLLRPELPVLVEGGLPVTLWKLAALLPVTVEPREMGALTAVLHRRTLEPPASLPAMRPWEGYREWLAGLPDLQERMDRAIAFIEDLLARGGFAPVLVHGDLHDQNVGVSAEGPLLMDLESCGRGFAAWDQALPVVAARRYGKPPSWLSAWREGYGELADPALLEPCVTLYELQVTAWAWGNRGHSPLVAEEAERRVATLRGSCSEAWTVR